MNVRILAVALAALSLLPLAAPATGVGSVAFLPPVRVDSQNRAALETSLALNPADGSEMAICSPSGVPSLDVPTPVVRFNGHGQSFFYLSRDAGATWDYLRVEPPGDARRNTFEGGDCDVAFDAGGTLYTADLWLGSIAVGSTRDHGATWVSTPVATTLPVVDRPWLVGGPAGTVHMLYHDIQFAMPGTIWYTRSTDYGATFSVAIPVAVPADDRPFIWMGNLVVSPDGQEMGVVYTRRATALISFGSGPAPVLEHEVWVATSRDAGLTWTNTLVSVRPASASHLYPSIARDAAGILHVVFAQATATDQPIWYAYSTDGGATWSVPVKVLADVRGYSPWVDARDPGRAVIVWYGSPNRTATLNTPQDWFHYWAVAEGADVDNVQFATGTTTAAPVFSGKQGSTAEFNQVRLDADGLIHIGTNAMWTNTTKATPANQWILQYQRQAV